MNWGQATATTQEADVSFALFNEKGRPLASIGNQQGTTPGLNFFNQAGTQPLAILGVTPQDKPLMLFKNTKGETTWRAGKTTPLPHTPR